MGIVVGDVDLAVDGSLLNLVLRSVVTAVDLGVHEHSAACRLVEPSKIQYGFGLTGSKEVPSCALGAIVHPYFHPGVVVVGMCPTRGVDLTCRYADGPEGGHAEGRLLTAASAGCAHGGERARSAAVGGLVGDVLMTPAVGLDDGIVHAHALDALLEFFVAGGTESIEIFVVHAQREYKVQPFALGNDFSPGHFMTGADRYCSLLSKICRGIVSPVGRGHIGIEELECLACLAVFGKCQSLCCGIALGLVLTL